MLSFYSQKPTKIKGTMRARLIWKIQIHIILKDTGFLSCTLGLGQVSVMCENVLSCMYTGSVAPWNAGHISKVMLMSLLLQSNT